MTHVNQAHTGDELHLVADVQNGDGRTVIFRVVTSDGDSLATIPARVERGIARGIWLADPRGRRVPLDLKLLATIGDHTVEAGALRLYPPGPSFTTSLLLLSSPSAALPRPPSPLSPSSDDLLCPGEF